MANMCDNSVIFRGEPKTLEKVKSLFRKMKRTQEQSAKWHRPAYITVSFSYIQEISMKDENIFYQTRWLPNFDGLIQIADHFGLDFTIRYSQVSDCISGEASYMNHIFNDIRFDQLNCGFSR